MPLPNENVFTEPFRLYPMARGPWSLNRSASQLWPLSIGVMTATGTPSRSDPAREIAPEPLRHPPRQRRDDDVLTAAVGQRFLDRLVGVGAADQTLDRHLASLWVPQIGSPTLTCGFAGPGVGKVRLILPTGRTSGRGILSVVDAGGVTGRPVLTESWRWPLVAPGDQVEGPRRTLESCRSNIDRICRICRISPKVLHGHASSVCSAAIRVYLSPLPSSFGPQRVHPT